MNSWTRYKYFPDASNLITLDKKSDVYMDNNGNDTNNTRYIARILHFARNGETYKLHRIDCREGGLQYADISTKNVG